jgi:hypothetical protein
LGSGYVINVWNRSGNSSAGHGAVSFFHQTRMVLKASFRINRVLCDSGFYEIEFIEYLELNKLTYIISVPNILPLKCLPGEMRSLFHDGEAYFTMAKPISLGSILKMTLMTKMVNE